MRKRVADMTAEELKRARKYRRERPIASPTRATAKGARRDPHRWSDGEANAARALSMMHMHKIVRANDLPY
jgi:hypothetical protein